MASEVDVVNDLLAYTDNLPLTSSGITDRKTRTLRVLQERLNVLWTHADWWFRWRRFTSTVALNATNAKINESDFSDFPASGARCWITSNGNRLYFRPEAYIQAFQENPNDSVSEPEEFSIYGQDASTPYGPLVQVRKVTATVGLAMWAHRKPPTLSLTTPQLHLFPDQWVLPALVPACRALMQKSKGDIKEWESHAQAGLLRMLAVEPQMKAGHWTPKNFFGDGGW